MRRLVVDNDLQTLLSHINDISSDKDKTILLLFTGSKDSQGISWCSDCVQAEPVLKKVFADPDYASDDYVLITISVGDKPTWKNSEHPFRKHKELRVKCVPTLINWTNSQRLEESQLFDEELVKMLLE